MSHLNDPVLISILSGLAFVCAALIGYIFMKQDKRVESINANCSSSMVSLKADIRADIKEHADATKESSKLVTEHLKGNDEVLRELVQGMPTYTPRNVFDKGIYRCNQRIDDALLVNKERERKDGT